MSIHTCKCLHGTNEKCPAPTGKNFAQGHDARMASRLAQAVADGKMILDEALQLIREAGGSELLAGKMRHSANLRSRIAQGDSRPKPERKPKVVAPDADLARMERERQVRALALGQSVQAWHGKRPFNAVTVENENKVLVARHRLNGCDCDHETEVTDRPDGEVIVDVGVTVGAGAR